MAVSSVANDENVHLYRFVEIFNGPESVANVARVFVEVNHRIKLVAYRDILCNKPTLEHAIPRLDGHLFKHHVTLSGGAEVLRIVFGELVLFGREIRIVEHVLLLEVDHDEHQKIEEQAILRKG